MVFNIGKFDYIYPNYLSYNQIFTFTEKRLRMTNPNAPHQNEFWIEIVEILKSYNVFLIALIYPLNKAISKYFEYKKNKDKELTKEVVTEVLEPFQREVRQDLKEIKNAQEADRLQFNKDIRELIREINKR